MHGRVSKGACVLGAVALAVWTTGCSEFSSRDADSGDSLRIVEQVQIDQNGDPLPEAPDRVSATDPAGDGKAICPPLSIAVAGALKGADAVLGVDISNGIQLAVDKHNEANSGCQVQLKTFDTEGDPQKAVEVARQITDDAFTIGLIGPAFSDEAAATGGVFDQAGMAAVTASATSVELSANGWRTFFRGLANDGVQGTAVANYMKNHLGKARVCVVDSSTDYGLGLARAVRETLGPAADPGCNMSVSRDAEDFSEVVAQINARSPDSVFFAGYFPEAARFLQQLRDGGVTAEFISGDGTNDPEFVSQAGDSSEGAVVSCSCGPPPAEFVQAYTEKFNEQPGAYSAGGYDLGTVLLRGIDSGAITRPALLDFVRAYDGHGLERRYQWAENGELTTTLIWIYRVQE